MYREHKLMADFETTIEREGIPLDEQETEVWLYDWCPLKFHSRFDKHNTGTTINEFFDSIFEFGSYLDDDETVTIYFHNLKFDGYFVADYLFKHNILIDRSNINTQNVFYSFSFIYDGIRYTFRDSLKLLTQSVRMIAKTYKMDLAKGETPLLQYPPSEIKPEWLDYVKTDVGIVAKALYDMFYIQKVKKNTAASEALRKYKEIFEETHTNLKGKPPKGFDSWFRYFYPVLDQENHENAQLAYKGGWSYCNPIFQGLPIETLIKIFDENSKYPATMLKEKLPYGKPVKKEMKFIEPNENEVAIYHVMLNVELKKNHLPTFQAQNGTYAKELGITAHDYIRSTNGLLTERWLTNVDLNMIFNHYDVLEINYIESTIYKSMKGLDTPYIELFREQKENATSQGQRTTAKLYSNSLYGKFGAKDEQGQKVFYLDNDEIIKLRISNEEPEPIETIYTPKATFITAYARADIQSKAQANYNVFLYSDTDSLHFIDDHRDFSETLTIHPKTYGCWKLENIAKFGLYLRAKLYLEEIIILGDKKIPFKKVLYNPFMNKTKRGKNLKIVNHTFLDVKGAGMTPEIKKQVTKENFKFGMVFTGKRMSKRVKGGILLVDTEFTIKKNLGFGGR